MQLRYNQMIWALSNVKIRCRPSACQSDSRDSLPHPATSCKLNKLNKCLTGNVLGEFEGRVDTQLLQAKLLEDVRCCNQQETLFI